MDFSLAGLFGLSSSIEKVGLGRVTAHGEDDVDDPFALVPVMGVVVIGFIMDGSWASSSNDNDDDVEGEAQVESGVVSVVLIVAA